MISDSGSDETSPESRRGAIVLIDQGHYVVAVDNLEARHRETVHPDAVFVWTDLVDTQGVDQGFLQHDPGSPSLSTALW